MNLTQEYIFELTQLSLVLEIFESYDAVLDKFSTH
ncbi:hypothetical protein NSTC745_06944 [Nostoc sp. DSM 114161]|jgi:hypothetical protein